MRLLVANEEVARLNSNSSLNDVERVARSYHQFLSWSTLLGRAISQPLGRIEHDYGKVTIPRSGLPRTTRLGRAVLPEDETQRMVNDLRRAVYPRDWADRALTQLVDDAAETLQHVDGTRIVSVNELHGQAGVRSHSPLDKLCTVITDGRADERSHADQRWADAFSSQSMASSFDQRAVEIELYRDGQLTSVTRDDFQSGLRSAEGAVGQHRFSNRSLNNEGVNSGATVVDPAISRVVHSPADARSAGTLTSSISVIQFGNFTRRENLTDQSATAAHFDAPPVWQEPEFAAPNSAPTPPDTSVEPDWDSLI